MRKRSFQSFPSLPQQALPPRTANAPAIAIDGIASLEVVLPLAPPAIGFRDVTAHADRFQIHERLITVIALIRHDLVNAVAVRHHRFYLLGSGDQGLDTR